MPDYQSTNHIRESAKETNECDGMHSNFVQRMVERLNVTLSASCSHSGRTPGVLMAGSTSLQQICTDSENRISVKNPGSIMQKHRFFNPVWLIFDVNVLSYRFTNIIRRALFLCKRNKNLVATEKTCTPYADCIFLWLQVNWSCDCRYKGYAEPWHSHANQRAGTECNAAMWSSVTDNVPKVKQRRRRLRVNN